MNSFLYWLAAQNFLFKTCITALGFIILIYVFWLWEEKR